MAAKTSYKISYNVDDASSEDGRDQNLPTPPKSENVAPATKKRAAAAKGSSAPKVAKPKAKPASGNSFQTDATGNTVALNAKRKPLDEIPNPGTADGEAEEVDEFDQLPNSAGATNMPSISTNEKVVLDTDTSKPKPKATKGRTRQKKAVQEIPETQQNEESTTKDAALPAPKKKGRGRAAKVEIIPETQPDEMDIDKSTISESNDQDVAQQQQLNNHAKREAVVRKTTEYRNQNAAVSRKRAGSASDTERAGQDPALRRKLGDMTKKFESLELKYNSLRGVAEADATSNFDALKQRTDEKSNAADELIASLRSELAAQKAAAEEASKLHAQIQTLTAKNEALASEKKTLVASLAEAQSESKGFQAKLAASRSNSNPAQGTDGQSHKNGSSKMLLVSNAEAAKEAQKRMLKEDLYSDLTGLIILDVKRREEEHEDVYDCIQTGRNGTLHFHLIVANPSSGSGGKSASGQASYEDAEFQYTPLLDENRDKDLIEILPDYLTEEICFPRSNAAKFYSRVVDCLTKKVELVDEE